MAKDPPAHRNGTVPVMTAQSRGARSQPAGNSQPPALEQESNGHFNELAAKTWQNKKSPPKVTAKVVKQELWDQLERDSFPYLNLLELETLQAVEQYLWPGYTDSASDYHVLLLAILITVKRREKLPSWTIFNDRPSDFSSLFRRALSMTVDPSTSSKIRTHLLAFIISAFESLDNGLVRKECAALVGIGIWQHLHTDEARAAKFNSHVMLSKMWRSSVKRYDAADDQTKARLRFERSWLNTLLIDFLDRIYHITGGDATKENLMYCERFVEFLIDLQSQLPTRRFVNSLVHDLNLLPAIFRAPIYADEDNGLFRDMVQLLQHYSTFPIDDQSGAQLTAAEYRDKHYARISKLQREGFRHFPEKLKVLTLSNSGSISSRSGLEDNFKELEMDELIQLCQLLGLRTEYPSNSGLLRDTSFYLEVLIFAHEGRPTFQDTVKEMTIVPTESTLYETSFSRTEEYDGSRPLALPKVNLQYLTMGDFLWRSFILSRSESFYAIRIDVEEAIKRLNPCIVNGTTQFQGQSRMALPIPKPAIVDIADPNVGETHPSRVRAELTLDVWRLQGSVRREWESLRTGDVVFMAAAVPFSERSGFSNGHLEPHTAAKVGLKYLRAAEVVQVQDEHGKIIREARPEDVERRPRTLRLIVHIDSLAYQADAERLKNQKVDVYNSINLLIRRRGRENNFKPILESIRKLTLSDVPAPSWLQGVFLGYDDPTAATYKRLSSRLKSIDFRDTFLDWQHLIESLPGKILEPSEDQDGSFPPPYVLETIPGEVSPTETRPSKKRRREQDQSQQAEVESVKVSTYKPPNTGPYPQDAPKLNTVRFTPSQIDAITSGTQPGLTIVIGPPGTGKTDVATQIINNIYHNFPKQRTLLVAHSNQALNQLFQKIIALDIDERHLLRLGHGEEELETTSNFSKYGRVDSFLERGAGYLAEVNRLAGSLGAPGAHGNSCETADYFNQVYVKPLWTKYWESARNIETPLEQIMETFPFYQYFSNVPEPLFSADKDREQILDIVQGCYRHIEKIFTELEDIRPFEVLHREKDKANYLLIKEARIIAMTATHAAMRRQEIAELGFRYDNVIMEEAAQITEIESFMPLALQKPQNGNLPLQRVVLIGDHLQNSPVIQNRAFRDYANLEQSLFLRLVRLGVPTIMLDQQGRARPSIASLYKWRYPQLTSLPSVLTGEWFQRGNAGFRYDYQFINVPDYKGKGEAEPSPHFIQNLGEAEYAVALFMYMRLLGYPADKITILAMYAGQRALIRDVLGHRCKGNRLFGLPKTVSTVDRYQGEQNDYIILSMTRTKRPGYIRDLRRLTVAISRSRLGLYVLGRKSLFESCFEVQKAFDLLFQRPETLQIVTGEMHPTERALEAHVESTEMTGVEHLGQYVFEMTKAKVAALKESGGLPSTEQMDVIVEDSEDGDVNDPTAPDGYEEVEEVV